MAKSNEPIELTKEQKEFLWEAFKIGWRTHMDVEHPNARVRFEEWLLLWEAYKAGGRAHLDVEHPNARVRFEEWLKELDDVSLL